MGDTGSMFLGFVLSPPRSNNQKPQPPCGFCPAIALGLRSSTRAAERPPACTGGAVRLTRNTFPPPDRRRPVAPTTGCVVRLCLSRRGGVGADVRPAASGAAVGVMALVAFGSCAGSGSCAGGMSAGQPSQAHAPWPPPLGPSVGVCKSADMAKSSPSSRGDNGVRRCHDDVSASSDDSGGVLELAVPDDTPPAFAVVRRAGGKANDSISRSSA